MQSTDFSLPRLYDSLDQQRRARRLSWAEVAREINRGSRGLSPSTMRAMRTATMAEADGVLQMLRWLGRTPESFASTTTPFEEEESKLPAASERGTLRFDTAKLYAALDTRRIERRMTWSTLGKEVGMSAAQLARLSEGGRIAFPHVIRVTGWLNTPAAAFVRVSDT